jgi:hypothetical protein
MVPAMMMRPSRARPDFVVRHIDFDSMYLTTQQRLTIRNAPSAGPVVKQAERIALRRVADYATRDFRIAPSGIVRSPDTATTRQELPCERDNPDPPQPAAVLFEPCGNFLRSFWIAACEQTQEAIEGQRRLSRIRVGDQPVGPPRPTHRIGLDVGSCTRFVRHGHRGAPNAFGSDRAAVSASISLKTNERVIRVTQSMPRTAGSGNTRRVGGHRQPACSNVRVTYPRPHARRKPHSAPGELREMRGTCQKCMAMQWLRCTLSESVNLLKDYRKHMVGCRGGSVRNLCAGSSMRSSYAPTTKETTTRRGTGSKDVCVDAFVPDGPLTAQDISTRRCAVSRKR